MFPGQVEEVLRLVPGVTDVAVVGVPDARLGEVPVAFIVGRPAPGDVERICREHLVAYKIPVELVTIDELPRSEVGKIARHELVSRYHASS